jgi:hypothetical protein
VSAQTFVIASVVAGVLTLVVLLWGLNVIKLRSSRLFALKVGGWTVLGGLALWFVGGIVVNILEN